VLNALVEAADPEECLRQADHADECAARGEPLGAAHGLPVVVKDVMKVAGLACSGGSRTLRAVAHTDATAVGKAAGRGRHRARSRVPARGCRGPGSLEKTGYRKSQVDRSTSTVSSFRFKDPFRR
jgi:hypothetical protein